MDFVYICGPDAGEELRYSIRSVIANAPFKSVWVIGSRPSWYTGNFIEVPQTMGKYDNAISNLKTVCESAQISNDFVLMNDDFFIIKRIRTVSSFHGGPLSKKIEAYSNLVSRSLYVQKLEATHRQLLKEGIDYPLDYDLHIPMRMNKKKLMNCLDNKKLLWRSLYGNRYSIHGKEMPDVKIYSSGPLSSRNHDINNTEHAYLSSDNASFPVLRSKILEKMFPNPTIYESDLQV